MLVGCGVGDALGMPFETLGEKVHEGLQDWDGSYRAGTWHKLPPGHYTDDTEMSICLAQSLIANRNGYSLNDAAWRYLAWSQLTPHGMGDTTRNAMVKLKQGCSPESSGIWFEDPNAVGSGPPMRASPLGVFYHGRYEMTRACYRDAYITHHSPEAIVASLAVATAVRNGLYGHESRTILKIVVSAVEAAERIHGQTRVGDDLRKFCTYLPLSEFSRRGNARSITVTALHFALTATNFRDGVIAAVRFGGDCDTRGAIAGAILGARFGLEGIPEEYKIGLLNFEQLRKLDEDLPCKHPDSYIEHEGMTGTLGRVICPTCGHEREWDAY